MTTSSRKVAIITGAAGGIGKGCAAQLAADGYALVIADLRAESAENVAAEFVAQGHPAIAVATDITQPDTCTDMIVRTVAAFGRIDVLVNSAGISRPEPSLEVTPENWRRMIDVQLNGTFFCCQAAGRQFVAQGQSGHQGGVIVNISSINAEAAFPMRTAYSSAKAGVGMMTKTLAIEWAQYGIRVNAVGPSHTETEMTLQNIARGAVNVDVLKKRVPLGRLAKVEDVANAVSFLCSDKASFITGQTLFVDGGYLAFGYW